MIVPSRTFIKGHSAFDKGPARIEMSGPHLLDIYIILVTLVSKQFATFSIGNDLTCQNFGFTFGWYGISRNSVYFRPTTGSLMLLTALHAGCDRVQVYGMGYQSKYTLYYFDDHFRSYNISDSVHYLSKEIRLMKALHESEIIDWYQRLK